MRRALIITADDFGLSLPVNEAVEAGYRSGILTAASLMVGAPNFGDAVDRARTLPGLGIGLHVTLLDGRPVLPPDQVPGLVGSDGRFFKNPEWFGAALFFSTELRRQAVAEVRAQFERFGETGLPLDHVNGHKHFHMHPVVANAIATIAPAYGLPPVRLPVEPFRQSYAATGDRPIQRLASWLFYFLVTRLMRRRFLKVGVAMNDQVFGINDSGAMVERTILQYLDQIPQGVTEIYCHPASRRWPGVDNLPPHYQVREELAALISPVVRAKIEGMRLRRMPFRAAVRNVGAQN